MTCVATSQTYPRVTVEIPIDKTGLKMTLVDHRATLCDNHGMAAGLIGLLLFVTGVAGGFMNTVAGGASLLCLPVLVWIGLDATVANATTNTATMVQALFSTYRYARIRFGNPQLLFRIAPFSFVGAIVGAFVVVGLSADVFQKIVGVLMVLTLALILKTPGAPSRTAPIVIPRVLSRRFWIAGVLFFVFGLYGGFFGGGVGLMLLPSLVILFGLDYVTANGVKAGIAVVMNTTAFVVFVVAGLISWQHAFVLTAGMMVGTHIGIHVSLKRGPMWVRRFLVVITVFSALWFLFG
ncbi:MAG: sulfite exporter TauE/SafE family protein [Myxococcales bacterium]|nr:sulfite exporter TauE/SafE family protein [Myxococcales bacterium]